jgi:flagellar protein FliS
MESSLNASPATLYAEVGRRSQIDGASPHKLIELLLLNAVKHLKIARECFDDGEVELRGKSIAKVTEIVAYLRISLDLEKGGDIAVNLHDIYLYIEEQLVGAHADGDLQVVDHVRAILSDLLDTWLEIKDEV